MGAMIILRCHVIEPTNPAGIQPVMQSIDWALGIVTGCARIDSGSTDRVMGHKRSQMLPRTRQ
jgi:hypothetical protein